MIEKCEILSVVMVRAMFAVITIARIHNNTTSYHAITSDDPAMVHLPPLHTMPLFHQKPGDTCEIDAGFFDRLPRGFY